jgi:hypothetical protein
MNALPKGIITDQPDLIRKTIEEGKTDGFGQKGFL